MKKIGVFLGFCLLLSGCTVTQPVNYGDAVSIVLSDDKITVDGVEISSDTSSAVYTANDIVYYEEGKDETYGEGTDLDAHSVEEASAHTVVHITKAGTYRLTGTLSCGQVAIDLGEDANENAEAVVTLILDNVNVTSTVAPAIIFYNVYESNDTTHAGANVVIADGSVNTIQGSYVAKIYKEGTEKKLHKYDGAFYSKMTMILNGNTGVLNIISDNEGLDSEMHLTINGGIIHIQADDDGINTNEDGVSITTVNDGTIVINSGYGVEGDGIDSNGSIVINGGTVISMPCNASADGGLDSDLGITINGGTVLSFGMNGEIATTSTQNYITGALNSNIVKIQLGDDVIYTYETERRYSSVLYSSSDIDTEKVYTINYGDASINMNTNSIHGGMQGGKGDMKIRPDDFDPANLPDDFDPSKRGNENKRPDDLNFEKIEGNANQNV